MIMGLLIDTTLLYRFEATLLVFFCMRSLSDLDIPLLDFWLGFFPLDFSLAGHSSITMDIGISERSSIAMVRAIEDFLVKNFGLQSEKFAGS